MARFDSPGDAILVTAAFYERTRQPNETFTHWLHDRIQSLLAGGYLADEGQETISPERAILLGGALMRGGRYRYRLTERGNAYLQEVLAGDDQNPVHLPDVNFAEDRAMLEDIRERRRRGVAVFSLGKHYR